MNESNEALKIWEALRGMVDAEIDAKTKSCMRSQKMSVTTAPDGTVMGVSAPFGEEIMIPYTSALSSASVGDAVWVTWYYGNASTMIATAFGDGQSTPSMNPFPVGSIYLSVSPTSPASLFGGTWERIKDTFLLCAGDTYAAGGTGGEASHTLTTNEMPSHTHSEQGYYTVSPSSSGIASVRARERNTAQDIDIVTAMFSSGSNQPHNNMPPYLTVYAWKRTA